jgi:hypothetical protein
MATVKRRTRVSQSELSHEKKYELLTGKIRYSLQLYYNGYGDHDQTSWHVEDFISDEMRRDWANHRDELLKIWASGDSWPMCPPWLHVCGSPDTLPWAERVFGSGQT